MPAIANSFPLKKYSFLVFFFDTFTPTPKGNGTDVKELTGCFLAQMFVCGVDRNTGQLGAWDSNQNRTRTTPRLQRKEGEGEKKGRRERERGIPKVGCYP